MTDALLPCPGCGRSDLGYNHVIGGSRDDARVYYRRTCPCGWWAPAAGTDEGARAQWNRRAPALRWTTVPPTVPGLYVAERDGVVVAMHVPENEFAGFAGSRWRWLGPISEPEEGGK